LALNGGVAVITDVVNIIIAVGLVVTDNCVTIKADVIVGLSVFVIDIAGVMVVVNAVLGLQFELGTALIADTVIGVHIHMGLAGDDDMVAVFADLPVCPVAVVDPLGIDVVTVVGVIAQVSVTFVADLVLRIGVHMALMVGEYGVTPRADAAMGAIAVISVRCAGVVAAIRVALDFATAQVAVVVVVLVNVGLIILHGLTAVVTDLIVGMTIFVIDITVGMVDAGHVVAAVENFQGNMGLSDAVEGIIDFIEFACRESRNRQGGG